jgi:hypothetical protein
MNLHGSENPDRGVAAVDCRNRRDANAANTAALQRRPGCGGIIPAFLPFATKVSLTKDLIFTTLLPPLLFEAAFHTPISEFTCFWWFLSAFWVT